MDKKPWWKRGLIGIILMALCAGSAMLGVGVYENYQMGRIPGLSFQEALEYTTKDNAEAVISVGTVKDGQISYTVYGENGEERVTKLHTYEIGSLTKTFTAAMIYQAVREEKVDMNGTIDRYLTLPEGKNYPTIEELLTHTSGYDAYYFESPMIGNFLSSRNSFYGITKEMVFDKAGKLRMDKESRGFVYSNYGYAVLGLVLEAVYDAEYTTLVNTFAQDKLGLHGTKISDQGGDLGNYWDWNGHDAYLPAGGVTSNMVDMLSYAQMQLEQNPCFAGCHNSLKAINASTEAYKAMGIYMDEIGMAWMIDRENGIIWHNGGTGAYNSYLGFHPEMGTAVVVLSNLPPDYRIPATVLGVKRLRELCS